jgi:hypothetical protein
MAAFLQAHPFFLGQKEGCGNVLEDIIGWGKVMPIRPMRDLLEEEGKGRELLRGVGKVRVEVLDGIGGEIEGCGIWRDCVTYVDERWI